MTDEPTATVGSVEVNANDLEAAIDRYSQDDTTIDSREGGFGVYGEVAIKGDSYNDHDCHIANVENVNTLTEDAIDTDANSDVQWTNLSRLNDAIEEALLPNAVEYVEDIVAGGNTVVASSSNEAANSYGDVEIQYGHMNGSEMASLDNDEATTFSKIVTQGDTIHVSVHVDESEIEA